ncbi:MAG: DUF4296 domain-containing protein [Chitinophagaceae bacterium]|jgi:hypothetical protein|nr:DUF4296 domain-containing protein [Chitinophagaceae bacterium]
MKYLLFFFLIFICACKDSNPPEEILSPEKMQIVLWDMIRADEFLVSYVLRDTSLNRKMESLKMYEKVFELHEISKVTFERSLKYYEQNPKILKPIMDSLHSRADKRELIDAIPDEENIQGSMPVKIKADKKRDTTQSF